MDNIDYKIRVSKRAQHARIVVRPDLSVEVVLPEGVSRQRAVALLQEKKAWVERSLKRFSEHAKPQNIQLSSNFPEQIHFESIGLKIALSYRQTDSERVRITQLDSGLQLSGNTGDATRVKASLQRWLKQQAKKYLSQVLAELAEQHGFSYRKVVIRLQKSRWGSCSKSGDISLNAKLLFLPQELMRYVLLHELAHLKQMNHSEKFWSVVAECDADYLLHRKEMRRTFCWIPVWAELD
ncbi:MAG: SprT family zinc-dependent metalloprotease [Mariprofundaceae bacterium]